MCQRERIAEVGCFSADVCCADRVVLSVGPVSLRLERGALEQLAGFLRVAQRRLVIRDEHGSHWREIARTPDLDNRD